MKTWDSGVDEHVPGAGAAEDVQRPTVAEHVRGAGAAVDEFVQGAGAAENIQGSRAAEYFQGAGAAVEEHVQGVGAAENIQGPRAAEYSQGAGAAADAFVQGAGAAENTQGPRAAEYFQGAGAAVEKHVQGAGAAENIQGPMAAEYFQGAGAAVEKYAQGADAAEDTQGPSAAEYSQGATVDEYFQGATATEYIQGATATEYCSASLTDGSAQRPRSGIDDWSRGIQSQSELVASWHHERETLGNPQLTQPQTERTLYRMAHLCTKMMTNNQGVVGDVARSLGGSLVTPPVDPSDIKSHFGDRKGFPQIGELLTIISGGVPVVTAPAKIDLTAALRHGNHPSAAKHMPLIWKKIADDVRRQRCLIIDREAARSIRGLRVSPLGVVETHKARIINDLSFDPNKKGEKGGLNADTDVDTVPPCLCAEALPKFLAELVSLRKKCPTKRLLMATTDVNDAFRNVRVDSDKAQNFAYTVDGLIVIDFRLPFGWAGSPGNFGVMASAAEHAHCHTKLSSVQLLAEGERMVSHIEIVDPWEEGEPTPVPPDAEIRPTAGGELDSPLFTVTYVDDHGLLRAQHSAHDKSALVASASLASDYVRLFGPGETGETPILAPKKSSNWNTTLEFLGFFINSHTLTISVTEEKARAIKALLTDEWPRDRRHATAQEVFSVAGKLWNLTYIIKAGKYFVWRLLRLTGLHNASRKNQNHIVKLGREFHDDIDFWRWAINHELLVAGESLCAPCYVDIARPAKRHYLSDASFDAIGGYCPELKKYWRYDLPLDLASELKRKAACRETSSVTINLLELVGMVLTAWVMHELVGDHPAQRGDPIRIRGDNFAAVTWSNRCGGAKDKRAALMMRMLGRLEIRGGWRYSAKHIPGVQNTLADGISRWPRAEVADRIRLHTKTDGWREQSIGPAGERLCAIVLQTKNIHPRHDEMLWQLMTVPPRDH